MFYEFDIVSGKVKPKGGNRNKVITKGIQRLSRGLGGSLKTEKVSIARIYTGTGT